MPGITRYAGDGEASGNRPQPREDLSPSRRGDVRVGTLNLQMNCDAMYNDVRVPQANPSYMVQSACSRRLASFAKRVASHTDSLFSSLSVVHTCQGRGVLITWNRPCR